jgi:hypothetical protein
MGVGVLGEPLTPKIVAAFGRILAGSVLATRHRPQAPPAGPAPPGEPGQPARSPAAR